jgi:hypothetical protein
MNKNTINRIAIIKQDAEKKKKIKCENLILFEKERKNEMKHFNKDNFRSQVLSQDKINNTALCIVCREPSIIWLEFLNNFIYYDIYIVINNKVDIEKYKYDNINFIQIDTDECKLYGFNHANRCAYLQYFPEVTAWDKALYYFTTINTNYQYIWFIEDDCFFMSELTIVNIDNKYKDEDLLTKSHKLENSGANIDWIWSNMNNMTHLKKPYAISFIQACRLSSNLLAFIKKYANENKKLFVIEAMFNTIALKKNLKVSNPYELSFLYGPEEVSSLYKHEIYIYHAEKNIDNHKLYRTNYFLLN